MDMCGMMLIRQQSLEEPCDETSFGKNAHHYYTSLNQSQYLIKISEALVSSLLFNATWLSNSGLLSWCTWHLAASQARGGRSHAVEVTSERLRVAQRWHLKHQKTVIDVTKHIETSMVTTQCHPTFRKIYPCVSQ